MADDNNSDVTLASLLRESEFELWQFLEQEFPACDNFRILYSVQPSLLVRTLPKDRREREPYLEGVIQFLVVSREQSSDALLAVVEKRSHHGPFVIDWLGKHGLSVVEMSEETSPHKIRAAIRALREKGLRPARLKQIGNRWEADVNRRTQLATRVRQRRTGDPEVDAMYERYYKRNPAQFHVFQEFPVRKAINVFPDKGKHKLTDLQTYAWRARFDVLVTSLPPNATPKLAIEYDGPWHDKPESKKRDGNKDDLCRRAGLRLLRIHYSHWPSETNVVPFERAPSQKDQVGKQLFDFVLHAIITKIEPYQMSKEEKAMSLKLREATRAKFEEMLKETIERTGIPESSMSEKDFLEMYFGAKDSLRNSDKWYRAIEESLEDSQDSWGMDRAETLSEIAMDGFPYSWMSSRLIDELEKKGVEVTEVDFKPLTDGLRGSILLKEPASGRFDEPIVSPCLMLTGIGFDEGELLKYTRVFISEWLYTAALERLDK